MASKLRRKHFITIKNGVCHFLKIAFIQSKKISSQKIITTLPQNNCYNRNDCCHKKLSALYQWPPVRNLANSKSN
jgi:hypothetical protein